MSNERLRFLNRAPEILALIRAEVKCAAANCSFGKVSGVFLARLEVGICDGCGVPLWVAVMVVFEGVEGGPSMDLWWMVCVRRGEMDVVWLDVQR